MRYHVPQVSALALVLITACGTRIDSNPESDGPIGQVAAPLVSAGEVTAGALSLQFPATGPRSLGDVSAEGSRRFAVITLAGTQYDRTPVELKRVTTTTGDLWQTTIELSPGTIELTELFITDEDIMTRAAVPLGGSVLAGATSAPLPQQLVVNSGQPTVLSPEAVALNNYDPSDFGYDAFPDVVIKETSAAPYYAESSLGVKYCLGKVAMTVLVCDDDCESEGAFKDTCDLFAAYAGTSKYEKFCPKLTQGIATPGRTPERSRYCTGAAPIIAVPLGHARYRVTAKKRGYQDALGDFTPTSVNRWSTRKNVQLKLERTAGAALDLSFETRTSAGAEWKAAAYDSDGYLGEPTRYDSDAGAYTIATPLHSLDFGAVPYGESLTRNLVVNNVGNQPLQITQIRIDNDVAPTAENPGFALESGATITVAPGAQAPIPVRFQINRGDAESQTLRAKLHLRHNDAHIASIVGSADSETELELVAKVVSRCPASCDDSNVCTTDRCQPDFGCMHDALDGGEPCDDGNACSLNDSCRQGTCQSNEGLDFKGQVQFRSNPRAYMRARYCEWGNCSGTCKTIDYDADLGSVSVSPLVTIMTYDVGQDKFVPNYNHPENFVTVTFDHINRNITSTPRNEANWKLCGTSLQNYDFSYTVLQGAPYVAVRQVEGYVHSDLEGAYGERIHATYQIVSVDGLGPVCSSLF